MAETETANSVHLISAGAFGRAVAHYLRMFLDNLRETRVEDPDFVRSEGWPPARINVLAAWRPVPDLCQTLDDRSHQAGGLFIPLICDSAVLRLGPVIVPGGGACWRCWKRRSRQHSTYPREQAELFSYYEAHANSGPRGYLEPFATLGAAQIAGAIEACNSPSRMSGYFWQMDLFTREVATGKLAGIHDCRRCGLNRSPESRSHLDMRQALAHLWETTESR